MSSVLDKGARVAAKSCPAGGAHDPVLDFDGDPYALHSLFQTADATTDTALTYGLLQVFICQKCGLLYAVSAKA
jgi:hypothetical protein